MNRHLPISMMIDGPCMILISVTSPHTPIPKAQFLKRKIIHVYKKAPLYNLYILRKRHATFIV